MGDSRLDVMYAKKEGRFAEIKPVLVSALSAEVLGTTGLLRIKEIDGDPVKAEIDGPEAAVSIHSIRTTPRNLLQHQEATRRRSWVLR